MSKKKTAKTKSPKAKKTKKPKAKKLTPAEEPCKSEKQAAKEVYVAEKELTEAEQAARIAQRAAATAVSHFERTKHSIDALLTKTAESTKIAADAASWAKGCLTGSLSTFTELKNGLSEITELIGSLHSTGETLQRLGFNEVGGELSGKSGKTGQFLSQLGKHGTLVADAVKDLGPKVSSAAVSLRKATRAASAAEKANDLRIAREEKLAELELTVEVAATAAEEAKALAAAEAYKAAELERLVPAEQTEEKTVEDDEKRIVYSVCRPDSGEIIVDLAFEQVCVHLTKYCQGVFGAVRCWYPAYIGLRRCPSTIRPEIAQSLVRLLALALDVVDDIDNHPEGASLIVAEAVGRANLVPS